MDADHYGFVELRASRPGKTRYARYVQRLADRTAEKGKSGYEVLVDGAPVGRFAYQTPLTFPVPVGKHQLSVRYWTSVKYQQVLNDRFLSKQIERAEGPPFEFVISEGERLTFTWGNQAKFRVKVGISQLELSDDAGIEKSTGQSPSPMESHVEPGAHTEHDAPSVPASNPSPPETSPSAQEHESVPGRVEHSGKCRYELREVVPVPLVAKGQRHVWRASAEVSDTQREPETGVRVQGSVSLGWVSLSLSKRLGVAPSPERAQRQRQELELTLDGDLASKWEIRVFDVWQIVNVETADGERVTAEYLSSPSAVAVPL